MGFISKIQKEELRRQIPEIKRGFDLIKIVDPGFYREMKNELFPESTNYFIAGRLNGKTVAHLKEINDRKVGIKDVIFNNPATIVIWEDDSKTVVKCQPGDVYDREKGLLLCIAKKYFGNKGNFNEVLKKYIPEELLSREELISELQGFCYSDTCGLCPLYNGNDCSIHFRSARDDELRDAYRKYVKSKKSK